MLRVPTYLLIMQYVVIGILYGLAFNIHYFEFNTFINFGISFLNICAVIAFWYVNGTALNDLMDYDIDLINLKNDNNRPLVKGIITKKQITNIAILSGFATIISASFLGRYTFILVIALLILNWAYSLKPIQISRKGGFAPTLLPLGYVFLPLLSGYFVITNEFNVRVFLFALALYLMFCSRILLKDFRDVVGDAKHGKITFLLKHGIKKVTILSGITFLLGFLILVMYFWRLISINMIPILFFVSIGITILNYLSQTTSWNQQKPYITIFGRVGTGILILLALSLSFQYQSVILWKQAVVSVAVVALIINSFGEIISAQRSR